MKRQNHKTNKIKKGNKIISEPIGKFGNFTSTSKTKAYRRTAANWPNSS